MELRHLRAFIAVAEELHFGRAAERLHIAQPPLSHQIRQLETELGTQLFERSTRSVKLTSAGQALLEPARTTVESADNAVRAARAGGRGEYGKVTIGFAGASSRIYLPKLVRAVRMEYPNLELVMIGQVYTNDAVARIADRTLDLGFARVPAQAPGVAFRAVENETLYAVLPADHPLAGGEDVLLTDLQDEPVVSFPPNTGSFVRMVTEQVAEDAGFRPRFVQSAPDSYTIHALVAAGAGVSVTVSSCLHVQQPGVVYLPLRGPLPVYQSAIAWHVENTSPAVQAVLRVAETALPSPSLLEGAIAATKPLTTAAANA